MLEGIAATSAHSSEVTKLWRSASLLVTSAVAELICQPREGATTMWWRVRDTTIEFAKCAGAPMAPVAAFSGPPDSRYLGTDLRVFTLENLIVVAAGHGDRVAAFAFPTVSAPENFVLQATLPTLIIDGQSITPWIVSDVRYVKREGDRRRLQITIEFFPLALASYPDAVPTRSMPARSIEVARFRTHYFMLVNRLAGGTAERPFRFRGERENAAVMLGYVSNRNVTLIIVATGCACKNRRLCACTV